MTKEQVYHTIIFTFRNVFIYFCSFRKRIYIVIVHPILADIITYLYITKSQMVQQSGVVLQMNGYQHACSAQFGATAHEKAYDMFV